MVTARELLSLVTARWQESLKNGSHDPDRRLPARVRGPHASDWGWGPSTWPRARRWGAVGAAASGCTCSRCPGSGRPGRPCGCGSRSARASTRRRATRVGRLTNESLGVVEVELLRRVNAAAEGLPRRRSTGAPGSGASSPRSAGPSRRRALLAVATRGSPTLCARGRGRCDAVASGAVRRHRRRRGPASPRRSRRDGTRQRHRRRDAPRPPRDRGDDDRRTDAHGRAATRREAAPGAAWHVVEARRRAGPGTGTSSVASFTAPRWVIGILERTGPPLHATGRTRAMGRLCETDGPHRRPDRDPQGGPHLRRREDPPGRHRARAQGRVPHRDRRGAQGARPLRADDPRGVRRPGRVAADLRAGGGGDRPRLDERLRHHQHALHRGLHADAARHRGAEAEVPARRWPTGEVRGAFSMSEPGCGSDVAAIKTKAVQVRRRTATTINGQKMWLTNGGSANLVAVLVKTDEGADSRLPEHDHVPGREGGRLRRDRPGLTIPGKIEKMGYKGVDTTEMVFEGHQIARRPGPRRRAGQGLLPDDGRRRGRPRQRRRPRLRGREPGLRARRRLRPAARDVRQEDRRAPGGAVPARGDGHQGRGRPPDDGPGRPQEGHGRAQRPRGRHGEVPRRRSTAPRSSRTPSGSTAATASPRSTRSSGSTARRRCC